MGIEIFVSSLEYSNYINELSYWFDDVYNYKTYDSLGHHSNIYGWGTDVLESHILINLEKICKTLFLNSEKILINKIIFVLHHEMLHEVLSFIDILGDKINTEDNVRYICEMIK